MVPGASSWVQSFRAFPPVACLARAATAPLLRGRRPRRTRAGRVAVAVPRPRPASGHGSMRMACAACVRVHRGALPPPHPRARRTLLQPHLSRGHLAGLVDGPIRICLFRLLLLVLSRSRKVARCGPVRPSGKGPPSRPAAAPQQQGGTRGGAGAAQRECVEAARDLRACLGPTFTENSFNMALCSGRPKRRSDHALRPLGSSPTLALPRCSPFPGPALALV